VRKIRRGDGRWLFIPKGQPSKAQGKPQPAPVVGSGGLGSSNSVPSGSGGKGSHAHLIVADETAVEPIYLDTKGAAEYISMSVGYVKDHARELGGEKHALRWRFDVVALDRWKAGKK
jgi:hypothetical protein